MKHNHAKCYICKKRNRYSRPVLNYILCQPCLYKLVDMGEVNIKDIQDRKSMDEKG